MARHGWHVGIELSVVGLRFNRNVLLQKMGRDGNMRLSGWNLRGSYLNIVHITQLLEICYSTNTMLESDVQNLQDRTFTKA
jgi:hypothetical protein